MQPSTNYFLGNRYMVWNVDENKCPIVGSGELGWSKISYEQVQQYWNMQSTQWGIRTGIQPNDKYIIGLDFDLWYKDANNYVQCHNTRTLWNEFFNILKDKPDGVFESSTIDNRGVLVDITNCDELIKLLQEIGKGKFSKDNYCLEILNCFNMVLPPSITKCKISKTLARNRKFMNDNYIHTLVEGSNLYDLIHTYILDCHKKSVDAIKQRDIRNKDRLKAYNDYTNASGDESFIKSSDYISKFLNLLHDHRCKTYNEWFKIGIAIKSSFGDAGLEPFFSRVSWQISARVR